MTLAVLCIPPYVLARPGRPCFDDMFASCTRNHAYTARMFLTSENVSVLEARAVRLLWDNEAVSPYQGVKSFAALIARQMLQSGERHDQDPTRQPVHRAVHVAIGQRDKSRRHAAASHLNRCAVVAGGVSESPNLVRDLFVSGNCREQFKHDRVYVGPRTITGPFPISIRPNSF